MKKQTKRRPTWEDMIRTADKHADECDDIFNDMPFDEEAKTEWEKLLKERREKSN